MDYHGFIDTIRNGIIECVENIKQTNDPKLKKIYAFVVASDFGNGNVWFEAVEHDGITDYYQKSVDANFEFNSRNDVINYLRVYSGIQVDEDYAPQFNEIYFNQDNCCNKLLDAQMIIGEDSDDEVISNFFDEYLTKKIFLMMLELEKLGVFEGSPFAKNHCIFTLADDQADNSFRYMDEVLSDLHSHNIS